MAQTGQGSTSTSTSTSSSRPRSSGVKIASSNIPKLVGLTDVQVAAMKNDYGIENIEDLAALEKEDFNEVLGTDKSTFLLRKKITLAAKYLRMGGSITSSTIMGDIIRFVNPNPSSMSG